MGYNLLINGITYFANFLGHPSKLPQPTKFVECFFMFGIQWRSLRYSNTMPVQDLVRRKIAGENEQIEQHLHGVNQHHLNHHHLNHYHLNSPTSFFKMTFLIPQLFWILHVTGQEPGRDDRCFPQLPWICVCLVLVFSVGLVASYNSLVPTRQHIYG